MVLALFMLPVLPRLQPSDPVDQLVRAVVSEHSRALMWGSRQSQVYPAALPWLQQQTGIGLTSALWFHEHEIAATATDTITFEVFPWDPAVPGAMMPMHCIHLVDMGLTQGQNWDLEDLAADCAADGQYDFFLEASPQPFVGGVGSPVNPVAIK